MALRPKFFLIFFVCGVVPILLLSIVNYLSDRRQVEAELRAALERDNARIATRFETALHARESDLMMFSHTSSVLAYMRSHLRKATQNPIKHDGDSTGAFSSASGTATSQEEYFMRADLIGILFRSEELYESVSFLDQDNKPLLRAERLPHTPTGSKSADAAWRFQTKDFMPGSIAVDPRLSSFDGEKPLRSPIVRDAFGAVVHETIPLKCYDEMPSFCGAFVADVRLDELFKEATGDFETRQQTLSSSAPIRTIFALDHQGQILYHTNDALKYQQATTAMPSLKSLTDAMLKGQTGTQFYKAQDGHQWLAAYSPLSALEISFATAADYTARASAVERTFWMNTALSVFVGLLLAIFLTLMLRRTSRSIEHITENAVAIAGGRLDQRLEVRSSDDLRLFADTFNQVKDQLREQMAREAEARQFQSFMRLSAMLTHDLKNSIAALSLLVSNMERQFHREEFRADAMLSLKEAVNKLRQLVSKLSDPVDTLSGEYKRPTPTNLVPIIRRVLAANAEPVRPAVETETRLPETLIAAVDAERIEKVFENLVINAVEAMSVQQDQQGKLTVEAGNINESEVFIEIKDTGRGMTEEFQRTRLFHPFATTKRKGFGLGLYTCREVVRAHGGHIDVESKEGSGTCFRVVLPSKQIAWTKDKSGVDAAN